MSRATDPVARPLQMATTPIEEVEMADEPRELTPEELEAQRGSELPPREVMSLISSGGPSSIAMPPDFPEPPPAFEPDPVVD